MSYLPGYAHPTANRTLFCNRRYFLDQPLMHPGVTDQHLLAWYFEDWLKKYFFSVLEILEVRCLGESGIVILAN